MFALPLDFAGITETLKVPFSVVAFMTRTLRAARKPPANCPRSGMNTSWSFSSENPHSTRDPTYVDLLLFSSFVLFLELDGVPFETRDCVLGVVNVI